MNYIESIESALGFKLNQNSLRSYDLTYDVVHKMYNSIKEYYRCSFFPVKKKNHIRPYFSPHYELGKEIHKPVNSYLKSESGYQFNKPNNHPLTALLKKHLLFVNSVCIHDPLIYLLDYFNDKKETEASKVRIPIIKFLLEEYSILRELILTDIITFEAGERFLGQRPDNIFLDENLKNEVYKLSKTTLNKSEVFLPILEILGDISIKNVFNNNIDLFLPSREHVKLYSGILKLFEKQFDSREIKQPYFCSVIGEINSIKTQHLSIEDIINLRKNEELFHLWRAFLEDVLNDFYNSDGMYSSKTVEFQKIANEKFKNIDSKLSKRLHNSNYLKKITDAAHTSSVGIVAGLMSGIALDKNSAIAMLASGTGPFIKLMIDSIRNIYPLSETVSINNHFYSLNLK